MRISEAEAYMQIALEEAHNALSSGEIAVGALIVKDGRIISRAHNLVESAHDATRHAELIAIEQACKTLGSWRLNGCSLIVTLEPCAMCTGAILNSRIDEVIFGAYDQRAGACFSAVDLASGTLGGSFRVVGGVLEKECRTLLTETFKERR